MLSSNTAWDLALAAAFLVGLILVVVSSAMLRMPKASGRASWPRLVDETLDDPDRELRLDMIERLALIPGDWSRGVLEQACRDESDPQVAAAAREALAAVTASCGSTAP